MSPDVHQCKNCGNEFSGNFCNNCGEKVYSDHDKKVSHIVNDALHFTTHLDNKYLKTLWLFFSKPGLVSAEFCEGKRKKYFKPVSMFLIAIVLYLIFPLLQGLNIKFIHHISNNESIGIHYPKNWAIKKLREEKINEREFAEKFDHLSPKFAKGLLLLLLPFSALSLSLIFRRKKRYFFDHFILSSEINSSAVYLFFMVMPAIAILLSLVFHREVGYGDTIVYSSIQLIVFLWVLIKGFMRFYDVSFGKAIGSSLLFIFFFALSVFLYRHILFVLVMMVM